MIIGRDGKTAVVKHGGLLRNLSKIHRTRIQDYGGEESEREEGKSERSRIKPEDVGEGEDTESGEEVICGEGSEEEVRRDEASHERNKEKTCRGEWKS